MKAFPRKDAVEIDEKGRQLPQLGMDLRDYFAAQAIIAYWSKSDFIVSKTNAAEWAYEMADEMMEARK